MIIKKKINLFLFGAGPTMESHINASKQVSGFNLYAINSRTKFKAESLKNKYKIKYFLNNINQYNLPKEEINIAIVAVSIENTFVVLKKIYKLFDICLIEKPAGYNYDEAKLIYSLSKKSKTKFFVSLNRRFYSSTTKLKYLLNKEKSLRFVNIIDSQTPKLLEKQFHKKIISNFIFSNSIHLIDYIYFICRGRLLSIKYLFSLCKSIKIFNLKFSSGDLCTYMQIWNRPGPWSVKISTKKKFYKLEPLEHLSYREIGNYKYKNIKIDDIDLKFKPGFVRIYKNLKLSALGKKNQLVSLKESLCLMKLINRIFKKKNI